LLVILIYTLFAAKLHKETYTREIHGDNKNVKKNKKYNINFRNRELHSYTHLFNGPFSGTTQVSRHQKGKTSLGFTEARDSEWQWHQLGHIQACT